MTILRPLREFAYPVEGKSITPDNFVSRNLEQIASLTAWEGNQPRKLKDLFKIDNDGQAIALTIEGDMSKVRGIGAGMTQGEVVIRGNAGMHLGEEMNGGKITVQGSVGSWAGSMMKNGRIEIHGNVGDYLAAPYRGSGTGMNGGRIIIHGNVGNEAGAYMKRGVIRICGNAGPFAGFRMRDGTVYIQGNCGDRVGACMVGGKVVVSGRLESVLPSFTVDSVKEKVRIDEDEVVEESCYVFLGDRAERGKGKLYVSKARNPHLAIYDKYL